MLTLFNLLDPALGNQWLALLVRGTASGILYLGPETIMPLASIIAAIIGVILIFWRLLFSNIKKAFQFIVSKVGKKSSEALAATDAADEIEDEILSS